MAAALGVIIFTAMIDVRPSEKRARFDYGWLETRHTFSFGNYYDPANTGFRVLRVINEDRVKPSAGFPTHPHRDMEIITYVLEGALAHRDSMGHNAVVHAGEVQRMTAGTGVRHSEYNAAKSEPVHLLQIWILPEQNELEPSYEQIARPSETGRLHLLLSPDRSEKSALIHQDVRLYAALLEAGQKLVLPLGVGRHGFVQVARGTVALNDRTLQEGDGATASAEQSLTLQAGTAAEVLVFDLP